MCMNDEMQLRLTARRTDCNEESKLAKRDLEWDAMGQRERVRESGRERDRERCIALPALGL